MGGPFSSPIPTSPIPTSCHPRRRYHYPFSSSSSAAATALLFFAIVVVAAAGNGLMAGREQVKKRVQGLETWEEPTWCEWCRAWAQRRLGGPGSSPPTCKSKCGRCSPCKPVHVPIQPGRDTPLEYYPEAWRCKCGNKLFMP